MRILIAIETITPGGAEWFALRTARALKEAGHEVVLWVLRPDYVDARLLAKFPDVQMEGLSPFLSKQYARLDSLLVKLGAEEKVVRRQNILALKSFLKKFKPDAIHSHLFKTDWVVTEANKGMGIPVVTTIHGDYLNFYYKQPTDKQADYARKQNEVLKGIHYIATISQRQRSFFKDVLGIDEAKLASIYNGYPVDTVATGVHEDRPAGLRFGLIARGIPDKGWAIAIDAFNQAQLEGASLILVGESDHLDQLKAENKNRNIIFRPFTTNPLSEIVHFDVGLLPSWYASESLPTTIIEYMALGKPSIASEIGEIRNMVTTGNDMAAIIIPLLDDRGQMAVHLKEAMVKLSAEPELYRKLSTNALKGFEQFKMETCIDRYTELYTAPKTSSN